jgi:hypothetical protein
MRLSVVMLVAFVVIALTQIVRANNINAEDVKKLSESLPIAKLAETK